MASVLCPWYIPWNKGIAHGIIDSHSGLHDHSTLHLFGTTLLELSCQSKLFENHLTYFCIWEAGHKKEMRTHNAKVSPVAEGCPRKTTYEGGFLCWSKQKLTLAAILTKTTKVIQVESCDRWRDGGNPISPSATSCDWGHLPIHQVIRSVRQAVTRGKYTTAVLAVWMPNSFMGVISSICPEFVQISSSLPWRHFIIL